MTTPATPTDDEMEQAAVIIATAAQANVPNWVGFAVDLVAQALADQRAQYEALADELDPVEVALSGVDYVAERIRQVGQR